MTTTQEKPPLQVELQAAIPALTDDHFAYHATDLYVVALPGVREFLQNYKLKYGDGKQTVSFSGFTSQEGSLWAGAGKFCYDIPFMGRWKK